MEYLFVVTYGRSGSTLLMRILNSIENYCIRGENAGTLSRIYNVYKSAHLAKSSNLAVQNGVGQPWFGAGDIELEKFTQGLIDSFVQHILRPPEGTHVLGFKEIRYTHKQMTEETFHDYLDFMATNLAPSKFIFNVRDSDQVKQSAWWKKEDPIEVVQMVEDANQRFQTYHESYPEYTHIVNYNEYVESPNSLQSLFEFLGEPFDIDRIQDILSIKDDDINLDRQ